MGLLTGPGTALFHLTGPVLDSLGIFFALNCQIIDLLGLVPCLFNVMNDLGGVVRSLFHTLCQMPGLGVIGICPGIVFPHDGIKFIDTAGNGMFHIHKGIHHLPEGRSHIMHPVGHLSDLILVGHKIPAASGRSEVQLCSLSDNIGKYTYRLS